MMPEIESPLDELPTMASVVAFFAKFHGLDAVRELVTGAKLNTEQLGDIAAEFDDLGLRKLAAFIEELAQSAPEPEPLVNPFDPNSANGRNWCRVHNQPPYWWKRVKS